MELTSGLRLLVAALVCCCALTLCARRTGAEEEDYYKLLGVPRDASEQQIKKAFRKLAIKHHPDKNPDPASRKKFEKIANAYDILSDTDKRREYDIYGARGPHVQQQDTHFDYNAFFTPGGGSSGFEHRFNFNYDDIFEEFFGEDSFFSEHSHESHHAEAHNAHTFFNFDMEDDEDSPFSFFQDFGGFGDPLNNIASSPFSGNVHFEEHQESQDSSRQSCKTVTRKVGNTFTTYTTCS